MINPGNKGEWAEIYIFLKLVSEGKVYMADEKMQRLASVYMKILRIFREEKPGEKIEYYIEDPVKIHKNSIDVGPDTSVDDFKRYMVKTWNLINNSKSGNGLFDEDIALFLESIHINKLKAPAQSSADFFGGTEDIVMEVEDYRSGIDSIMGFSCKSQFTAEATLFNASGDNTNFRYRITGNINDRVMNEFNNIYNSVNKTDRITGTVVSTNEVAVARRMKYLKDSGCDLEFVDPVVVTAKRNLIQSGGLEMPRIIGEMLKYYFFKNNGETEYGNVSKAIRYLADMDPIDYGVDDLEGMYRSKVGHLLYDMFTGMRMASVWSGKQSVTGGYMCAKKDGDVVAYHANVADEFRDFLVNQLAFETASASRHNYMRIEKEKDDYYISLNMQLRFAKSEIVKLEFIIEKLSNQEKRIQEKLTNALNTLSKRQAAKKTNPVTIQVALENVNNIQLELERKRQEIASVEEQKSQLLDGNGNY